MARNRVAKYMRGRRGRAGVKAEITISSQGPRVLMKTTYGPKGKRLTINASLTPEDAAAMAIALSEAAEEASMDESEGNNA